MLKTFLLAAFRRLIPCTRVCRSSGVSGVERRPYEADGRNDCQDDRRLEEKEATMHLDMSKAEMKKGDMAACMKHMNEAHKAMGLVA